MTDIQQYLESIGYEFISTPDHKLLSDLLQLHDFMQTKNINLRVPGNLYVQDFAGETLAVFSGTL